MGPYWIFLRYTVRNPIFPEFGWFLPPARVCTGKNIQYLDISSLEQKYISSTDARAKTHSGNVYFQKNFQLRLRIRSEKKNLESVKCRGMHAQRKCRFYRMPANPVRIRVLQISRCCIFPAQISSMAVRIHTGKKIQKSIFPVRMRAA